MKKQLSHISIHQTSKVFAIIYFVIAALICIPMGIFILFDGGQLAMGIMMFFMPFLYGLLGYIIFVIMSWLYNLIARSFGGIEFTLTDVENKLE